MKVRNRYFVRLGATWFTRACTLIFRTVRLERRHLSACTALPEGSSTQRYILSIWHDSVILPLFGGKADRLTVLTSRHADGSFVTDVLGALGIATIRGSTTRGGVGALRTMMRELDQSHLAITPDGPRGPRRMMTRGIVYLASRSGSPIVPTGFACSRCWRIKGSWTDLIVPKPFAKAVLISGEPIAIPPDISLEALDPFVQHLQTAMDRLDRAAHDSLRSPPQVGNGHANARVADERRVA